MATVLSARNAARYGADVGSDSWDGIYGGRPVIDVRADTASAARKAARRRVKHAERAAWRAEIAAELAADAADGPTDPLAIVAAKVLAETLDAMAGTRDHFFATDARIGVLYGAGRWDAYDAIWGRECAKLGDTGGIRPGFAYRGPLVSAGYYAAGRGAYRRDDR